MGAGPAARAGGIATLAAIVAAVLAAGCGSDDGAEAGEDLPDGPPRVAAAAVANRMLEAMEDGDGAGACALMTERGRRAILKVLSRTGAAPGAADCAAAIEAAAERAEDDAGPGWDLGGAEDFKPSEVAIGPTQLPGGRAGEGEPYAELACRFRGSIGAVRTDEGWRVFMPLCFD